MDNNSVEIELLKEQIRELKEENKELSKRISKVEQSREKTEYQFQEIMKALDDLNKITIPNLMKDIEEIKNKPTKRYDTAVNAIITGIISVLISFSISNLNK